MRKEREGESWKQVDRERKRERREKKIYKERQGGGGVIDGGHAKEIEKEREEIERE